MLSVSARGASSVGSKENAATAVTSPSKKGVSHFQKKTAYYLNQLISIKILPHFTDRDKIYQIIFTEF